MVAGRGCAYQLRVYAICPYDGARGAGLRPGRSYGAVDKSVLLRCLGGVGATQWLSPGDEPTHGLHHGVAKTIEQEPLE